MPTVASDWSNIQWCLDHPNCCRSWPAGSSMNPLSENARFLGTIRVRITYLNIHSRNMVRANVGPCQGSKWMSGTYHFPHDALHASAIGVSLRLLSSQGHDTPELRAVFCNQPGNYRPYFVITELRSLQVRLQNIHFPLLFFSQVVASTLLVIGYRLAPLLHLLLQHSYAISFSQRLSKLWILAIGARHLQVMDSTQRHAQRVEFELVACSLCILYFFAQFLFDRKFLGALLHKIFLLTLFVLSMPFSILRETTCIVAPRFIVGDSWIAGGFFYLRYA